jgi:glycosyltransferase involved in cell wall biosynthesis
VLLLTPWFPNRPGERQGNFIYASAAALARRGLQVGVLVTRAFIPRMVQRRQPEWLRDAFEAHSFRVLLEARLVRHLSIPRNHLRPLSNWAHDRRVGPVLDAMAREHTPDVIHAHTEAAAPVAVEVGRRLGIPVVVTVHGINTAPRYLKARGQRRRLRAAFRAADRIILVGEPLRATFRKIAGSEENFAVVPNGVDPSEPAATQAKFASSTVRFISVSNLHEGKGIDVTLHALSLVRQTGFQDWTYTIVGDGRERCALESLVTSLRLTREVRFLGGQPYDRIGDLLAQADVFVLPSYREAFGVAYLEAMAHGLVAIGVRGQGPQAFIAHGETGFLVEPRSAPSLAKCILHLVASRDAARRVAAAGAAHVAHEFTWDAHARRLADIYDDVAHRCRLQRNLVC